MAAYYQLNCTDQTLAKETRKRIDQEKERESKHTREAEKLYQNSRMPYNYQMDL